MAVLEVATLCSAGLPRGKRPGPSIAFADWCLHSVISSKGPPREVCEGAMMDLRVKD
jgi:hypothetical protein